MIKDLQKIVDLTSQECSNYAFKPIISERSGTGCYLTDCVIVDDELIVENEHILLNSIEEIKYGYLKKVEDRIETVYCDSIEEVFDFVDKKRKDKEVSPFFGVPMGTHFPFYEIDKVGGGFLIIRTDSEEFGIYFPTEKTTFEKQWDKDSQEKDSTEGEE